MVQNWIKMMNKVIFLIKQLIYDFIIAWSFYIVNCWNFLWIKIWCKPKSQIPPGSWPKYWTSRHYPIRITIILFISAVQEVVIAMPITQLASIMPQPMPYHIVGTILTGRSGRRPWVARPGIRPTAILVEISMEGAGLLKTFLSTDMNRLKHPHIFFFTTLLSRYRLFKKY